MSSLEIHPWSERPKNTMGVYAKRVDSISRYDMARLGPVISSATTSTLRSIVQKGSRRG